MTTKRQITLLATGVAIATVTANAIQSTNEVATPNSQTFAGFAIGSSILEVGLIITNIYHEHITNQGGWSWDTSEQDHKAGITSLACLGNALLPQADFSNLEFSGGHLYQVSIEFSLPTDENGRGQAAKSNYTIGDGSLEAQASIALNRAKHDYIESLISNLEEKYGTFTGREDPSSFFAAPLPTNTEVYGATYLFPWSRLPMHKVLTNGVAILIECNADATSLTVTAKRWHPVAEGPVLFKGHF